MASIDSRTNFRKIITKRDYGIILDANELWDRLQDSTKEHATKNAAFQLTSGKLQRKFITLWELFDEAQPFQRCIQLLTDTAKEILEKTPYEAIVTCTTTAKHLMEHVHPELETKRDRINVHYFGHYPNIGVDSRLLDLRGQRVLVIADVVATCTLLRSLIEMVWRLNGRPVAALCVVMTDPGMIDAYRKSGELPLIKYSRDEHSIRLHSLTDLEIPRLESSEYSRKKVIPIDSGTVYPDLARRSEIVSSCFDDKQMFAHFEETEALDFGIYEADQRHFMVPVRIGKLLSSRGDEIWKSIRGRFSKRILGDRPIFVTTFNRHDLELTTYIKKRLRGRKLDTVMLARGDQPNAPYRYVVCKPENLKQLEGSNVVLLLSSINTSERLRSLTTLLAECDVSRITVVCLLNRMGTETNSFVSRLRKLVRGRKMEGHGTRDLAHFDFQPIYSLTDVESEATARMLQTILRFRESYKTRTRVDSFRRIVDLECDRYFRAESTTSRSFERATPKRLADLLVYDADWKLSKIKKGKDQYTAKLDGKAIRVKTLPGKLFLLWNQCTEAGDFRPIFDEIVVQAHKPTLYKLFAIVLANAENLRRTKEVGVLCEMVALRVRELRAARFEIEHRARDQSDGLTGETQERISTIVENEANLLFGLSLFAFLDQENNYKRWILELVGSSEEEPMPDWGKLPYNLVRYYSEERILLAISMMLHFKYPRFAESKSHAPLRDELIEKITRILQICAQDVGVTSFVGQDSDQISVGSLTDDKHRVIRDEELSYSEIESPQAHMLRLRINLQLMLTELGALQLDRKDQVVAYLYDQLIARREFHNPIRTNLLNVRDLISRLLREAKAEKYHEEQRLQIELSSKDKSKLDDAIFIASVLQKIATATKQLFSFSPVNPKDARRFAETDFGGDVDRLGDLLQQVRRNNSVSRHDHFEINSLRTIIIRDLLGTESRVQATLRMYLVPFFERLVAVAETVQRDLYGDIQNIWEETFPADGKEFYVIIDSLLLREVLRNILTNARHNFQDWTPPNSEPLENFVRTDCREQHNDVGEVTHITFEWRFGGHPFSRSEEEMEGTTFSQHAREIVDYGGNLCMRRSDDGWTIVTLRLRTVGAEIGGLVELSV